MDKFSGNVDWRPIQKEQPTPPAPTLNLLLGVNSRLQEILLTSILASTHHRVHVVDSGPMAIQSLSQQSFDLSILSYDLPELTATATTKKIRKLNNDNAGIPIIALLEDAHSMTIAESLISGINSFIVAPYSAPKIKAMLLYYQHQATQGN